MLYAINSNKEKVEPTPKARAMCPFCKETVIACIGEIKGRYWRHEQKAKTSCVAAQYENEGLWHNNWKKIFGAEFAEIYCQIGQQVRKADVKLTNGLVMEVQHSSIDSREIRSREFFHRKMVWLFDATGPYADGRLKYEGNYFFWEQPRLSILKCNCPVFIEADFGILLEILDFEVDKYREEDWQTWRKTAFKGKCKRYDREQFKAHLLYADIALKETRPNITETFKKQFSAIKPAVQLGLF